MSLTYCPLFSGSSGNAAVLGSQNVSILVDAGLPGKKIGEALVSAGVAPEKLSAIVITHEHADHVKGAGVMCRRYGLPIYANARTWEAMEDMIGNIPGQCVRVFDTLSDFYIGDINVFPFPVPHDAADPVGYTFTCRNRSVGQLTDLGKFSSKVLDYVERCDILLIESNHDVRMLQTGRYPYKLKRRVMGDKGHLSNDAAGAACAELAQRGVKQFILGHLSGENNTEAIALDTVRAALRDAGDVSVFMAHRDRPCGVFAL